MSRYIKGFFLILLVVVWVASMGSCNNNCEQELEDFNIAFWFADTFNFIAYYDNEVMSVRTARDQNREKPARDRLRRIVFVHTFEEAQVIGNERNVLPVVRSTLTDRGVKELNAIVERYHISTIWRSEVPDISLFPITIEDVIDNWEIIFEVSYALDDYRRAALWHASRGRNSGWRFTVCEDMPAW